MMGLSLTELITLAIAVAGAGAALYTSISNRDTSVAEAWRKMIDPMRQRLDEVEKLSERQVAQIATLNSDVAHLNQLVATHEDGILRLAAQVVSLGGQPVYQLPGHPFMKPKP